MKFVSLEYQKVFLNLVMSFGKALEAWGGPWPSLGDALGCFGRLWGGFGEALGRLWGGFGEAWGVILLVYY